MAEAELSLLDQIDSNKTLNDASEEHESYNQSRLSFIKQQKKKKWQSNRSFFQRLDEIEKAVDDQNENG